MKKLLSTLIVITMLASGTAQAAPVSAVSADTAAKASVSVTDSKSMEKALLNVKSRIDIPAELTEFSGGASDFDYRSGYSFTWRDKENERSISVQSDSEGRILNYSYYSPKRSYSGEPVLTKVPRDKAVSLTEEFLKKAVPEAFADSSDRLEFDSVSFDEDSESGFNVSFKRMKNGAQVLNNSAYIDADYNDGSLTIWMFNLDYDYDAEFENTADEITDAAASYRSIFPEEMVYSKRYKYLLKNKEDDEKINLIYHMKDYGYISAYTGEEITPKSDITENYSGGGANASLKEAAADTASLERGLSPEEEKELETISNLFSAEDAEKYLRSIPQLKLSKDLKTEGSSLYPTGEKIKKYILSLHMVNNTGEKYSSLHASFDAKRKRLTSINNYESYVSYTQENKTPLTQETIAKGNAMIDSFLNTVISDKLGEFSEEDQDTEQFSSVSKRFRRMVNGIPYINNNIYVSYTPEIDAIDYYNLSYEDEAQFPSAETALSGNDAYAKMLELAPMKKLYVPTEDGYRLAYTMDGSPEIDALNGEDLNALDNFTAKDVIYDDISGHWCETAVNELRDNGIALNGTSFRPDEAITQEDLLRLFAAGSSGRYMLNRDTESLYEYCYNSKIITEQERNENAAVTREQAFILMVRMAGFEKVAKLPDIYKVSYADGDLLSEGTIGYAAILSGMGVITGDGSTLRPQDNITRAEAATMLYRYMNQ
ncbi:MAG: S-layer homology domain-containing protein [bacterium]|nr:S-layer homology domain-containing protein [bacterium]